MPEGIIRRIALLEILGDKMPTNCAARVMSIISCTLGEAPGSSHASLKIKRFMGNGNKYG
ncbi:hypothetical protein IAD21_00284 [Abditibacteriota bacterium]|nr:hypothetical protein IAD21_00284 [Abditibacteriota bacterium]